ncbi:hypothetical protein [uncultured Nitrospira sp.]|uniref:hypothetical protein n=1 Tax=uncultured Nitrospira sp. TaxID=157176 RepID=UPI0031401D62
MDKREARELLSKELKEWRQRTYAELASFVDGDPVTGGVQSEAGNRYQYEIQVIWDEKPGGNIRVLGAIDDGGVHAFFPLTDDFILAPNGDFIGEDSA